MDKFKRAQIYFDFSNEMVRVRDMLGPIVDGEIERGHCTAGNRVGLGGVPGKRKTTLADARAIAKTCIFIINRAVNEFNDERKNDNE